MPKTLLLADDSVTIQKVVGITFANEDVEVVTVDNGNDALSRAREIHPALVLADVTMPGLDGYDLCAAIKSDASLDRIPVLLLTGTFEAFDEGRAKSAGADGHISKPFEAQVLVDQVHQLMARVTPSASEPVAQATEAQVPQPTPEPPQAEPASEFSFDDLDFADPRPAPPPDADPLHDPLLPVERAPRSVGPAVEVAGLDDFGGDTSQTQPILSAMKPGDGAPLISIEDALYEETSFLDPGASASAMTPDLPSSTEPAGTPLPESPLLNSLSDVSAVFGESLVASDSEATGQQIEAAPVQPEESVLEELPALEELRPLPAEAMAEAEPMIEPEAMLEPEATEAAQPEEDSDDLPWADALEDGAEDAVEAAPIPAPPLDPEPEVSSPAAGSALQLDPDALHRSLEKVAWEAFGSLSEQLVTEIVQKVEAIAWEVVPQLAERLIREEIARLKDETGQ